uniref:COP9 signalosome complex subunit 9 n=1 Tax=Spermophilus dauricus TaxID=99837 RepID=A0A8C9P5W5_SPEDA
MEILFLKEREKLRNVEFKKLLLEFPLHTHSLFATKILNSTLSTCLSPLTLFLFPGGMGCYDNSLPFTPQAGGSTGLLMDLAANEKAVHADFFNDFEDLFDDDDVQ